MEHNMKIYEIGTGYTAIPAQMSAATEIVVEELTKAFLKMGFPVEILDIASADRAEHALPIREVPVPACFSGTDVQLGLMHKLKRVVYSVCLARALQKLLKAETEKVVLHFHNQYNLFFFLKLTPRALRKKACIAYTNHSGIWRLPWQEIEDTIRKRYFQEAECMHRADLVFVLNPETKENAVKHIGVPEERLVLIANGVNADVYRPLPLAEKQEAREKWGFHNGPVILQVGSVYENKGQLRTAEYLLPLLQKHPDLIYAYAGGIVDAEYQQKLCGFAQDHGLEQQIRYLGMLCPGKELNQLYNAATFLICASAYEGASLVLLEGLAAGIPVLVERNTPFSLGEGCILYTPEDSGKQLADLLSEDASPYKEYCEAARRNAVSRYGWERIAADYTAEFLNRMKSNV